MRKLSCLRFINAIWGEIELFRLLIEYAGMRGHAGFCLRRRAFEVYLFQLEPQRISILLLINYYDGRYHWYTARVSWDWAFHLKVTETDEIRQLAHFSRMPQMTLIRYYAEKRRFSPLTAGAFDSRELLIRRRAWASEKWVRFISPSPLSRLIISKRAQSMRATMRSDIISFIPSRSIYASSTQHTRREMPDFGHARNTITQIRPQGGIARPRAFLIAFDIAEIIVNIVLMLGINLAFII